MAAAVTGAMIVVTGAVALVGDSMSKNWVPDCVATANGSSHSPSAVRVWSPSAPPNVTRPASSWFGVLGTVGLSGLLVLSRLQTTRFPDADGSAWAHSLDPLL